MKRRTGKSVHGMYNNSTQVVHRCGDNKPVWPCTCIVPVLKLYCVHMPIMVSPVSG